GRDEFAIRFHLHPSVKANRLSDAHGAMLVMANKEVWTFTAYEDRIDLEESVYLAGNDGPRRTVQLVIHGRACNVVRVQWTFALSTPPGPAARRGRGEELQ
ncbi:MAG TPA: heparinase II/III family protein, partial [Xanthobacteraceae bacterium]